MENVSCRHLLVAVFICRRCHLRLLFSLGSSSERKTRCIYHCIIGCAFHRHLRPPACKQHRVQHLSLHRTCSRVFCSLRVEAFLQKGSVDRSCIKSLLCNQGWQVTGCTCSIYKSEKMHHAFLQGLNEPPGEMPTRFLVLQNCLPLKNWKKENQ